MANKFYTYIIFILVIFFFNVVTFAMPPKLDDIQVRCSVTFDSSTNRYIYQYTAYNAPSNTLDVLMLMIDIRLADKTIGLPQEGHTITLGENAQGDVIEKDFKKEMELRDSLMNQETVVPVTLVTQGNKWSANISLSGHASFGVPGEEGVLKPGQLSDKLFIYSQGIPILRKAKVIPTYLATMEEIEEFNESKEVPYEYIDEAGEEFYGSISYHTKTIGPTAPPAELDPASFIDRIIALKHEAVELGWITNQGIIMGLDQKLEAAKQKLAGGQTRAAANILGAFIKEVEAQGCASYEDKCQGKHLTPEAYALLKYNAQYLVDNMQ